MMPPRTSDGYPAIQGPCPRSPNRSYMVTSYVQRYAAERAYWGCRARPSGASDEGGAAMNWYTSTAATAPTTGPTQ
jgi:hypothetical protein